MEYGERWGEVKVLKAMMDKGDMMLDFLFARAGGSVLSTESGEKIEQRLGLATFFLFFVPYSA